MKEETQTTSKDQPKTSQPASDDSIAEVHKKLEAEAESQAKANAEAHEKQAKEAADFQKKMDAHNAKAQAK